MNIKLVTRIFKEIIDEVFRPNKRKRGIVRSSRYFSNLSFLELRKALKEDKIDLIVDVGANSGQFYSLCRKELKYSGKVFSFEPNPVMVQILQDSQKNDPDWEVFPFALGAAEGTLSFNIYQDSKLSSFLNGTRIWKGSGINSGLINLYRLSSKHWTPFLKKEDGYAGCLPCF